MSSSTSLAPKWITPAAPQLVEGELLDQPEFHVRYLQMPHELRAELIGGVVSIMPSPVSLRHGRPHARVISWLADFALGSPGVDFVTDVTLILGPHSELQPDAILFVLPPHGRVLESRDGYVQGSPELVVEVAVSSAPKDLGDKKADYEREGVEEYLIVLPGEMRVCWYALEQHRYVELAPAADGILRSRVFPGLWLDPQALLNDDLPRLKAALQQGLASEEPERWGMARPL